jgi:hypothetical protein
MSIRLLVAYLLIAMMVAFFAALIAWKWYHAFHRVDRRRRLRDNEIYEERLAQREADEFADRPDPGESEPGRAP